MAPPTPALRTGAGIKSCVGAAIWFRMSLNAWAATRSLICSLIRARSAAFTWCRVLLHSAWTDT